MPTLAKVQAFSLGYGRIKESSLGEACGPRTFRDPEPDLEAVKDAFARRPAYAAACESLDAGATEAGEEAAVPA